MIKKDNYIDEVGIILHYHGDIDGVSYRLDTNITDITQFKYAVDNAQTLKDDTPLGFSILKDGKGCDATPVRLKWLFKQIKPLNELWKGVDYFLNELIKYRKENYNPKFDVCGFSSFDENVQYCVEQLNNTDTHYLHKAKSRGTDEAKFVPTIEWNTFFTVSKDDKINRLIETLPCLGTYHGRIILEFKTKHVGFDKYGSPLFESRYVGISCDDLVEKFLLLIKTPTKSKDGKQPTIEESLGLLKPEHLKIIKKAIVDYYNELNEEIKMSSCFYNFIMYDNNPKYTEEHISDKIRELWDVKLGGLDARTGTSLTDSYMTMLGWYFSPVNPKDRLAGSFYSPASGFGKTAFLKALCDRTDIVHSTVSQTCGSANQFSFSGALACGPDILQCDDPMSGTEDILNMVSNLVTNKEYHVEFKGRDRYLMKGLYTKVMITSNVPLYMKNDTNNFLTQKLFELQTNNMKHCMTDDASRIVDYIQCCPKSEISAFLNKCVKMYNDNPEWIMQHLGQYVAKEDEATMFACLLSLDKLKNMDNKTLIQCVDVDEFETRYDSSLREDNKRKWCKICKYIKTHYPDIAKESACATPKNNAIYPSTTKFASSRFQNYKLDYGLREIIIESLSHGDNQDECTCDCQSSLSAKDLDDLHLI